MIEGISDPIVAMEQLLGRGLGSFFKRIDGNLVAHAQTGDQLKARVTLHPDQGRWTLFLERQQDKNYNTLVVDDIMNFSANKKAAAAIQEFLRMHGVQLITSQEE